MVRWSFRCDRLPGAQRQELLVCDPVMGDWGRIYVAPEIVPLYRNLLRVTSVITPNQFEAE